MALSIRYRQLPDLKLRLTRAIGGSTGPEPLGPELLAVAVLAVDLALPLTQHGAVHPLVAQIAGETRLMPGLACSPHELRNEDRLVTPWADLGPAPLGFGG